MSELFNKEALQALDDKSELKEMPRVASPALWLILTSLLMICALALFWCIFGKLNYTVIATNGQKVAAGAPIASIRSQLATTTLTSPENGVVLTSKPAESKFVAREPVVWILPQELQLHDREVLAYVPFTNLRKVKIGAKVQVTPADLEREKWGYAVGTVTGIERYPTARQAVAQRLKLAELAAIIPAEQPVYEIRIVLDRGADGLIWSRKKSQNMAVTTGMPCNVQIIWSQKYVWEVLTGRLDNMLETLQGK